MKTQHTAGSWVIRTEKQTLININRNESTHLDAHYIEAAQGKDSMTLFKCVHAGSKDRALIMAAPEMLDFLIGVQEALKAGIPFGNIKGDDEYLAKLIAKAMGGAHS